MLGIFDSCGDGIGGGKEFGVLLLVGKFCDMEGICIVECSLCRKQGEGCLGFG